MGVICRHLGYGICMHHSKIKLMFTVELFTLYSLKTHNLITERFPLQYESIQAP